MHWYKGATTNVSLIWSALKNSGVEYTIPEFTLVSDYNNTIQYTLIGPAEGTVEGVFKVAFVISNS